MLRPPLKPLRRVVISLDAVGGVWRYAVDVARGLRSLGVRCLLVGFGPEPNAAQRREADGLELVWTHQPLDWTVSHGAVLDAGTTELAERARAWDADLLHLNLPSQAAGLRDGIPVVVASHSCVPTWWQAVRGTALPADWEWQQARNRQGFRRADAILVPSHSHGEALRRVYGTLPPLHIVHNAVDIAPLPRQPKQPLILSVGRWWDPAKNGATLDAAAASAPWPVLFAGPLHGPNGEHAAFRHVQTPGSLAHAEVLSLMRRAAIFAAPSRYEPFGLAVAEAAACGAALVLADIPTFRELWHEAALFVSTADADGWSRAFATLAADHVRRGELAAAAEDRAGAFTPPRQTARLYEIYSGIGVAA